MRRTPGWVVALGVWLAFRVFTGVVTAVVARTQTENLWTMSAPGYLAFVGIWDGRWYQEIAEDGYPRPLPVDDAGRPVQSAWAFFPAYPLLVRLVIRATGLEWLVAAPLTSLVLGCGVAVVAYRLFRLRASHRVAVGGVAVLAAFPSAPVLQYAYADVLSVLSLLGCLYLLGTRRYLWCLLPAVALGLSRPVGLPLVLVVLVHAIVRVRHRGIDPFGGRERIALATLTVVALISSLAFPFLVAQAIGRSDGYPAVQAAWRAGDGVRYFVPWWTMAEYLVGARNGIVVLALLALGTVAVLASRPVRALGTDVWTWTAAYALYLAAVVEPYTSLVRHLLLFAPLAVTVSAGLLGRHGIGPQRGVGPQRRAGPLRGVGPQRGVGGRRGRLALAAWLTASLALHVLWIDALWHFEPPTDPPP